MFDIIEKLKTHNWPLEGFYLDLSFTNWKSLEFNLEKIDGGNVDFLLSYLNSANLTLF